MENDDLEKTKYWIELAKWFIVSVALVLISSIVNWNFTSRDKSFEEVKFYSEKYMTELVVLNDKVGPRYKLAQFFKNVTVNKEQRDGWDRYFKEVKKEYEDLRKKDSLNKIEQSKILKKDSTKWSENEKVQYQILQNKIEKIDLELNSKLQLPTNENPKKHYIIVGGDKTIQEAEFEKNKFGEYDTKIIYRNGSYRTVIEFNSYENASKTLSTIKVKKTDAYIVNADRWCSNLIKTETYYECD